MNKICTTLKQSKKLIELGIDISTADMFWDTKPKSPEFFPVTNSNVNWKIAMDEDGEFPAWSLTGLLHTLPSASLDSSDDHHFRLHCMEKFSEWYDNPIDAIFEMIIRLKEKGLL